MRMLLCTIAAIGLCAALSARAQNIVTNGSFEDGTLGTNTTLTNKTTRTNWITGWELYQGNPTNSITNSLTLVSGGTDGTYAARYSVQSTPGSQANQVGFTPSTFMPVSLAFGSNFTFSLDLKRVDAGLADFRWIVFQRDSSNTLIGSATTFNWGFSSITTNWQTFSTNLALNPSTANLEFQFRYIPQGAFTSATVDIDNIQAFGPPVLPWVWNNAASNFSWATGVTNWTVNGNATNWVNGYGADFGATGAGTITVSGTNTVTSLSVSADGYSFTGGTLALGSAETAFAISNATTVASTIAGSNALLKTGNSTLTLSGANTYTGGTTLSNGVLRLNHASAAGTGTITQSSGTTLEINTTGTVANQMSLHNISTLQTVTLSGNKTLNNATYNVTNGTTTTESGALSGSGGITKLGTGTLVLTASNTFTGGLDVQEGLLNLNSATGGAAGLTASVAVSTNATLLISQSNQVNNSATTVSLTGGTIRTAAGVSEVFGDLTVTGGGLLDFGATVGNASSMGFGEYTPSALLTINNFDFGSTLTFKSDLTGTINNSSFFTFNNGGIANSSWDGTTFTITAIPEPSTVLVALGLAGLMMVPAAARVGRAARRALVSQAARQNGHIKIG